MTNDADVAVPFELGDYKACNPAERLKKKEIALAAPTRSPHFHCCIACHQNWSQAFIVNMVTGARLCRCKAECKRKSSAIYQRWEKACTLKYQMLRGLSFHSVGPAMKKPE